MTETLISQFVASVSAFPDRPALAHKVEDKYVSIRYSELVEQVWKCASGLVALGVDRGQRVAIVSENRPEWAITDLAALWLGAVTVPMFPTLPASQVELILRDSGARLLIVSGAAQRDKAAAVRSMIPDLRIIAFDGESDPAGSVVSFHDLLRRGVQEALPRGEFDVRGKQIRPSDVASLVYTSGTTGEPKGVMLTHGNFVSNVNACLEVLPFGPKDIFLSFLPLNHCLERMAGYYAPLKCGSMIAYAQSLHRLRENIREVEPSYLIMVPRIYEGIHQAVMDQVGKSNPPRRRVFHWALKVGRDRMRRMQTGKRISAVLLAQWWLAQRLVLRSVRATLGLRRLKHLVSGGAPLAEETAIFFHSAGLPLLEGYGMTEAAPVITFNHSKHWKLGSVGRPLRGVEVRIGDQGEILCRGPNIMLGYHDKPRESAETIDRDGWLHTGDVGQFDEDGFLFITGRIKDLIVLSNGKKIPPQMVESELLRSPLIAQVVAVGDGGPTLGALLVPRFTRLREHASRRGVQLPEDDACLASSREALKLMREEVERVSSQLADFERPHAIALLDRELTVESGALTPTLKIRRKFVLERYADVVQRIGAGSC